MRTYQPTSSDTARQLTVAASAVLALAGSAIGSGAFGGTPIDEAAGGALAADATLVAPAGPAFSIWSVIYAGLIALAVLQLLPARRSDPRQRRTGWLTAASLLLNAAWILLVQAGALILSLLVLVGLLVVLVALFGRLLTSHPTSRTEAVVVDGTVGLYLGWVSVATVAGAAATLTTVGASGTGAAATIWAVLVLLVAGAVGVGLAVAGRGRLAPAAGLCWGLAWIAVGRFTGEPDSTPAAVAASLAAATVLGVTLAIRFRTGDRAG